MNFSDALGASQYFDPVSSSSGFNLGGNIFGGSAPNASPAGGLFGGGFGGAATSFLGGANIGASFSAANATNQTAANIAEAQIEAANQARREAADYQIANNIMDRNAQFGWGADLAFQRDQKAFDLKNLEERKRALFSLDLANSASNREKLQFENRLALQKSIGERAGALRAMFGGSSPVNIGTLTA